MFQLSICQEPPPALRATSPEGGIVGGDSFLLNSPPRLDLGNSPRSFCETKLHRGHLWRRGSIHSYVYGASPRNAAIIQPFIRLPPPKDPQDNSLTHQVPRQFLASHQRRKSDRFYNPYFLTPLPFSRLFSIFHHGNYRPPLSPA